MADDILKGFFVALGYKEDEASKRRFLDGVAKAEKAVASLGLALAAATTAATAAAVKMAASFEDLFYASQRTGASINNLRGLAYAVSQLGGSYGGAVQSLEAFAKNLRTNPGYESMARKLGVATRENGKLRDTVDILTDLGKVFKGQRYEIANQYAQALGLDEKTFQLLRDQPDALRRYRDEYERTTKALGTNTKEMTEQGKALSQSWRSFLSVMEALSERIAATFFPIITKLLDYMREWVVTHGPQINAFWTQVGQGIEVVERAAKSAYDTVEPFVTLIAKKLSEGYNATGGAAETLKEMKQLFSDIGDMVKRAYEYIVKLIQLVGLDKVAAAFGAGIKGGFRESDWTGAGGMPDWTGGKTGPTAADYASGGGMPEAPRTGKGALAPYRRGMVGRAVDRVKGWFGGDRAPSIRKGYQGSGSGKADQTNYNFTGENADALRQAAKELGTSPEDLATVISYESKFRSNVWGGKGGNYMGLIQFGASERAQFGANDKQSFKEQLPAVVRYLKTRGFKPGMGLLDLYSTINAGSPGRYGASDGNGTVRSHVERMRLQEAGRVAKFLSSGAGDTPEQRPVGQATNVSDAQVIANDHGHYARLNKALGGMDFTARRGATEAPLGVTNNDNSSAKTLNMPQNITVNVQGGGTAADTANATVRGLTRFQELSLRNAQGAIR